MAGKILKFPEINENIKAHNLQKRTDDYHDSYWLGIHQKLTEDLERLKQRSLGPLVICLGIEEYKTLINIFSRRDNKFVLPKEYHNVPIVLVPLTNICAAVPSPDNYWFDFLE